MNIGITSTIPIEVVFAAGHTPCDLNNLFITDPDPNHFIRLAEEAGFPQTTCAWIKGIYGVLGDTLTEKEINTVIIVSGGDCSNSIALGEILKDDGKRVIPFSYPHAPAPAQMERTIQGLADELGAEAGKIKLCKQQLDPIRNRLAELDRLTWQENLVSGEENQLYLVNSSDFNGNPELFSSELEIFLKNLQSRHPLKKKIRLGLAGVPPILSDLYKTLDKLDATVVFNEVPRQFALPWAPECTLAEQYSRYTYPYQVDRRLLDIEQACSQRRIDGIIHYTQSFCFRQIEDILFKRKLAIPTLTLEADQPGPIDGRTLTRIETFIEMLQG
ncbi:MAG: 2-hydroxyacyl-CoA dehydratase family protein [Pseudomonadota bacterium]|nr:2-hydroxyacyl-CoA dehydratase family protein [Pseudomonadota bacterium]